MARARTADPRVSVTVTVRRSVLEAAKRAAIDEQRTLSWVVDQALAGALASGVVSRPLGDGSTYTDHSDDPDWPEPDEGGSEPGLGGACEPEPEALPELDL